MLRFYFCSGVECNQNSWFCKASEQLKYNLAGFWSRRINQEHRIIYDVLDDKQTVEILSLKGHY